MCIIHISYKSLIEFRLYNAFITGTTNATIHYSAVAGLVVSASDCGARGRGFEAYRNRVVSLSKTFNSPKKEGVAPSRHD